MSALQKSLVGLAALVVLAAAGTGVWWIAAVEGLVPGRPNSPRAENFRRALDEHLARTTLHYNRPCAPVSTSRPRDGAGPKDIRFDWTPASFRMVLDPRRPGPQNAARKYEYLARQGFFEEKALPEGGTEYFLTWKGMAAASGQGCFRMAGSERSAQVLSFSKKRTEHGIDIFEVVARPAFVHIEAWASNPGFREAYPEQQVRALLEPQPIVYELARDDAGFEVIAEQGRAIGSRPRYVMRGSVVARLAGDVTPDRVRAAIESYLGGQQGQHAGRICLAPPQPHEADEHTLDKLRVPQPGMDPAPVTFTIYNLLTRQAGVRQEPLRGYLLLKKLESLGLATSEVVPAAEFRGQAAAGAVRFTLTKGFVEHAAASRCYPVATAQVEEVVRVDPFSETNLTPQFLARITGKPLNAESARIFEAFPHFARMQAVGGVLRGTLQYHDNELRVVSAHPQYPVYYPDPSDALLPVVESPLPPPRSSGAAPMAGKPAAAGTLFEAHSAASGRSNVDISVKEVERRLRASVIQVDIRKLGSSVGSSFFIACSIRKLAQQRGGARTVAKLEDVPRRGQMTIGFLKSPNEPLASVDAAFAAGGRQAEVVELDQFGPVCDRMK